MKISELVEKLSKAQAKYGDMECVVEIDDFLHISKIKSTVETLTLVDFAEAEAVLLDWRTLD